MKRLVFFLLVAFLGCRRPSEVLFKAGNSVTSVADYQNKYGDSLIEPAKLDEMIEQKLFALEGHALKLDSDTAVKMGSEEYEKSLLLDVLYEEVVTKKARVSTAQAKDVYDKLKDQYRLAQIVLENEATARQVLDELNQSAPFETLAVKYSVDENSRMYGGNIGMLPVQAIEPDIYERIKGLAAGAVTKPFPYKNRYYIVKMIEHKTVDLPAFASIKDELIQRLEIENKNKLAREFIDGIFKHAAVEYNPKGLEIVVKDDSLLAPGDLDEWVVKKYKTKIVRVRTLRPAVKRLFDLYGFDPKILVEREIQADLLRDEAARRNLNRREDYQAKVKAGREELVSQKFYDQEVLARVTVDTLEMAQYYKEHKAELKKPYKDAVTEIWTLLYDQNIKNTKTAVLAQLKNKYPVEVNQPVVDKYSKENK